MVRKVLFYNSAMTGETTSRPPSRPGKLLEVAVGHGHAGVLLAARWQLGEHVPVEFAADRIASHLGQRRYCPPMAGAELQKVLAEAFSTLAGDRRSASM